MYIMTSWSDKDLECLKAEKSISLRNLLPELTQQEIANEIGVGIATVKRYLKK